MRAAFKHAAMCVHRGMSDKLRKRLQRMCGRIYNTPHTHRIPKNTRRTCTTAHTNRAHSLHNFARSPTMLLMDRTSKRSCTNTIKRSISRLRTCMRAVYHAEYMAPTVQMAPTAPVHRTHSRSPSFLSLRRFASVCAKRQLVQKTQKSKNGTKSNQ